MINIIGAISILYIFAWLFIIADELKDKIIDFFKIKIGKKDKPKKYNSIDEMMKSTITPSVEIYHTIYRFFMHIKEAPTDLYNETKWFIQRGIRGYSDRDLWGFNYYLSEMIPKGLKHLKRIQHILPTWKPNEKEEIAKKRWHGIMDDMIYTFETAEKIACDHYIYCPSKSYNNKVYTKLRKDLGGVDFTTIMTLEECKRYEQGWKYFQKHFFSLWD